MVDTDFLVSSYGFLNEFRPPPLLPNQVYRLDPVTSAVRVVATDFDKCNGIAFSPDGKLAYMCAFNVFCFVLDPILTLVLEIVRIQVQSTRTGSPIIRRNRRPCETFLSCIPR